jgi:hypothetical protein
VPHGGAVDGRDLMNPSSQVWFALVQYSWLAGLVLSAYGAGVPLIDGCRSATAWPRGLRAVFCITSGLGVLILAMLALCVSGTFTPIPLAAVLSGALVWGMYDLWRSVQHRAPRPVTLRGRMWARKNWFWLAATSLIALPFVVKPLQPPIGFDELMYHLPHAKLWAQNGRLTVNPWLRFPLFPSNFDLLYAAALLFGNDVLPHLIHALAGTLVTIGVGVAGARYFGKPAGALSALLLLASATWGFDVAYIDLGLTLFVAFGFWALALWFESAGDRLAVLAAFLFGLAAGTKYQALLFVPIGGFWIIWRARRVTTYVAAAIAFAVGGAFWYVRGLLVSGDPFHPLGAPVFGYWLWDPADLAGQIGNIASAHAWPKPYMLAALPAVCFLRHATPTFRALSVSGYAALALWCATSRYERYLMPAYPLLALMSGVVIVRTAEALHLSRIGAALAGALSLRTKAASLVVVLLIAAVISLSDARRYAVRIAATPALRDAFLRERLAGYEIFSSLPAGTDWRLYQLGFEGELYYAPVPTVGDWFGPARYRSAFQKASDPAALASWLRSLGVNGLLVRRRDPFEKVQSGADFHDHFELVMETRSARLYRLRTLPRPLG